MFCSQLFYAPKKAETTCFVTFLSGDKKNQKNPAFLDSFKCLKRRRFISLVCFLCFVLHEKIFIKKSIETPRYPHIQYYL